MDKAIEVELVVLLAVELWHADGGPVSVLRLGVAILTSLGAGPP